MKTRFLIFVNEVKQSIAAFREKQYYKWNQDMLFRELATTEKFLKINYDLIDQYNKNLELINKFQPTRNVKKDIIEFNHQLKVLKLENRELETKLNKLLNY